MKSRILGGLLAVWVLFSPQVHAQVLETVPGLEKKLIEFGWDMPNPEFIRSNIRQMEKRPFDGLIFKLRGGRKVLEPVAWEESAFAADLDDAANIAWEKFTENFVIMNSASDQDWFNDRHWEAIGHNVRLLTKVARVGRCVGVCFDPEPYGANPWHYATAAHHDTKSFAEYEAVARRRGAQFIRAIQGELPKATILMLFHLSFVRQALQPMEPAQRAEILSGHHYGLLPAFLNGMLDAAAEDARIIDGNETAYYYTKSQQHFNAYHQITQQARLLIDPQLWEKYRRVGRAGQALYIDQYFGLRTRRVLGHAMTPEERPRWLQHNAYWSLYTTDKYVWCYSERMNWWTGKGIPPGCEEALRAARKKIAEGEPLGFDLRPLVEAARKRSQ